MGVISVNIERTFLVWFYIEMHTNMISGITKSKLHTTTDLHVVAISPIAVSSFVLRLLTSLDREFILAGNGIDKEYIKFKGSIIHSISVLVSPEQNTAKK